MGTDYRIRLDQPLGEEEAVDFLVQHFGLTKSYVEPSGFSGPCNYWNLYADGLSMVVRRPSLVSVELTREKFDIGEQVCFSCRIDTALHCAGFQYLMQIVVGLLVLLDCDLAVDVNGEKPILFRRASIVYVDLRERFWRDCLGTKLIEHGITYVPRELDVDRPLRT